MEISELSNLREREDHVEFKEAKHNYPFAGGQHVDPKERRRCVLGYIVALANERGGKLVLGMSDRIPHEVVGTDFAKDEIGQLEDEIYKRLHVRVHCKEFYDEKNRRVLVLNVPSRPIGKALRFEGVPLMRTGESLREMDDQEYFSILQEQDPDFSAKICPGLTMDDLSDEAIKNMRKLLYDKNGHKDYLNKPLDQLLIDMQLQSAEGLNYAALILLGKKEAIRRILPQNNVIVEYRITENQIRYSARQEFCEPIFVGIDKIWAYLNQPGINPLIHINDFPQVVDIPSYTEETVREAILNSIQHRNFQMVGDILIKVSPESLVISNNGGFPFGVNLGNILTVNSSPRSRRLAEVIEKAGLIERSGQGVDIMFANCISEGRCIPDYTLSDDFQVTIRIQSKVENVYLRKFLFEYQKDKEPVDRFNVFDLITIYSILHRDGSNIYSNSIKRLIQEGIVLRHARFGYILGDLYFKYHHFVESGLVDMNTYRRLVYILEDGPKSMSSFLEEWGDEYTVKQIRNKIDALVGTVLSRSGKGRGTVYEIAKII